MPKKAQEASKTAHERSKAPKMAPRRRHGTIWEGNQGMKRAMSAGIGGAERR